MKEYPLGDCDDWDSIETVASILETKLGWHTIERIDGPDARIWRCARGSTEIVLVYDDLRGLSIRSESDMVPIESLQRFLMRDLEDNE